MRALLELIILCCFKDLSKYYAHAHTLATTCTCMQTRASQYREVARENQLEPLQEYDARIYACTHTVNKNERTKYNTSIRIVFTESTCFIPKLDIRRKIGICECNKTQVTKHSRKSKVLCSLAGKHLVDNVEFNCKLILISQCLRQFGGKSKVLMIVNKRNNPARNVYMLLFPSGKA